MPYLVVLFFSSFNAFSCFLLVFFLMCLFSSLFLIFKCFSPLVSYPPLFFSGVFIFPSIFLHSSAFLVFSSFPPFQCSHISSYSVAMRSSFPSLLCHDLSSVRSSDVITIVAQVTQVVFSSLVITIFRGAVLW